MKKIILTTLVPFLAFSGVSANLENNFEQICTEVWGKYAVLESYPIQEKCNIDWELISKASFEEKYNRFVKGIMINYFTEYKYSDATKWKSYNDFLAQDIKDLKTFQSATLDSKVKTKIDEYVKIQENFYNFLVIKSEIGEKRANLLEKNLAKFEERFSWEYALKSMHKKLLKALTKKIEELEYLQMVAKFTPEGYKSFLLELNSYKYLKLLVEGRLQ